jgi:hypothetical protein
LIGVIGAFYSGGGQQDGAAAKGGPVSGPGADAGADGAAAGDASVPGWLEFSDPNGQYKVRMPRLPAAPTKQHWPIPNGNPAEATVYTVEIGGGVYSVAYLVIPGRDAKAPVDPVLDDAISGGMAWFSGAAIKSRTNITHQGFTGRQVVLEYPGVKGSSVLRVIIAGNRMFWVMAKGDNFSADSPKVIGFLNSLKIN